MMRMRFSPLQEKMFSPWMAGLCLAGLGINFLLVQFVRFFGLPLYLDNIGCVLVAILGGPLPGTFVGLCSNLLNSVSNPLSMYYGILTILIAWVAAVFSQRGWLMSSGCAVIP